MPRSISGSEPICVSAVPSRVAAAVAATFLAPLALGTAFAQSNSDENKADAKTQLELVVITANKRRQLQQEVAGTVTAVSGSKLESLGAVDSEDVMKLTPGVQFNKGPADASLLSIRGVSTNSSANNQGFTQAPTGIYIEDVPFTDPFAFVSVPDLAPFDLERVEVLRGPQGALYGSSSLGGAIRYLLKKPNLRQTQASVLAGFSSVSDGGTGWTSATMVNLPLADGKAGLRAVVNARQDAGFIDNVGTGIQNSNRNRVKGGRLLFTYKPDADFDLTAIYLRQNSEQFDGSGISSFDYVTGNGYGAGSDRLLVKTAFPQNFDSTFDLGTIQANLQFSSLRVSSITGYQTKDRILREDFSRDFYDPGSKGDRWTSDTDLHTRSVTQEFRLTPIQAGDVNWLVGAFWMDGDVRRDQKVFFEPRGASPDIRLRRRGTATEAAAFADVEVKLDSKWSVAAGARYYQTKLDYVRTTGVGDPGTSVPYASDQNGTTPKVSLRYAVNPELSTYVLAAKGYRFGGISNLGSSPVGRPYKSDSLWNYEAGLRWRPTERASLDLSVFRIDWKDVQLAELYLDPTTNRQFLVTGNAGRAKSQGLEVAGAWRPTNTLSLRGTLAYTDAVTSGGITIGGTNIADGSRLPGTAKLQGTLDASLNFEGPLDSSGRFSAVWAHTGERRAQIDSRMTLPSYSTLDLRLALSWSYIELAAFVSNAMNARGISGGVDYPGLYTEYYPIRPRTSGLTLRYDF